MACHCRRVVHPLVGRSIACVSIYAEPFFTNLKAEIPKSHLFVDRVFFACFISPSHEHVLKRVAERHFGMGIFWDERILPMLPGWDRAGGWYAPPIDRHYAPPPPPPDPKPPRWNWKAGYYDTDQDSAEHEAKTEKRAAKRATRPSAIAAALRTLGLPETATLAQARKRYREGCLERHPDRGGSQEKMVAWNSAWDAVKNVL